MADSKEEKKVRPYTTVEFRHNGKSKFHSNGQISVLHPEAAEKMKDKGYGDLVKGSKKDRKGGTGEEQTVTANPEAKNEKVSDQA